MNLIIKLFLILIVLSLTVFLLVRTVDEDNALVSSLIDVDEAGDDDDDELNEERLSIIDGYKAIQLDEEVVENAGLEFSAPQKVSFHPEYIAYADVVDIAPLVLLRAEYLGLLADKQVLESDLYNRNKNLKRATALHEAKSLSTRDLEKSRAEYELKSSELRAIKIRVNSFKYKLESLWGETISDLALQNEEEFKLLATNRKSIILLSLPKNKLLKNKQQNVFVNYSNDRETAEQLAYLDQAKEVKNPLYGQSYYYLLQSENVRLGMRLFAWVEEESEAAEGYLIEDSAVIWYANEPWVYVNQGEDLFIRKPLSKASKLSQGWFLNDNVLFGDGEVVSKGGQILLSEEFKWAIPDEDDD